MIEAKKELRKKIRGQKAKISLREKKQTSVFIWEELVKRPAFHASKTIMLYWSMDDEVHTHDFVVHVAKEKQVILPSVKGDELELKWFKGLEDLKPGEGFAIPEPGGAPLKSFDKIDLVIVPGIAFDIEKNRMGRGKAYYDKLLKQSKAYKIGTCFDFQLLNSVPVDEHDVKMDEIITEKRRIL